MQNHTPLLEVVEDFLSDSKLGESYFGKVSVGNSELVKRLRNGGRVLVETDQKVRSFIVNYSPKTDAPSSAAATPGGSLPSKNVGTPVNDCKGAA